MFAIAICIFLEKCDTFPKNVCYTCNNSDSVIGLLFYATKSSDVLLVCIMNECDVMSLFAF